MVKEEISMVSLVNQKNPITPCVAKCEPDSATLNMKYTKTQERGKHLVNENLNQLEIFTPITYSRCSYSESEDQIQDVPDMNINNFHFPDMLNTCQNCERLKKRGLDVNFCLRH